MSKVFDLFIIGGGINGAGIARDAAGRGLSVCLADKGEIGGATSSWSTKLIHGGLRYLENYEFKLVRESLKEREIVYKIAKHISKPIPFIIPYADKIRPAWLIKFGLFLYDNLGGKSNIPKSKNIKIFLKAPLNKELTSNLMFNRDIYEKSPTNKLFSRLYLNNYKFNLSKYRYI